MYLRGGVPGSDAVGVMDLGALINAGADGVPRDELLGGPRARAAPPLI
jgi:hypothetical protein